MLRRRAVSSVKRTDTVAFIKAGLLLFMALAMLLTVLGVVRLSGLFYDLVDWCRSVVEGCLPYVTADVLLFWLSGGLIVAGLLYASIKNATGLLQSYLRIKRLPLYTHGASSVVLIRDDTVAVAFTHGLLRPKIYISTGLMKRLGRDELLGVMYHEIHHRRRKDPLKILALSFLKDALFYLPVGRCLEERIRRIKEMEADRTAARRLESPIPVARALLKLKSSLVSLEAGGASIAGYELRERIEALLGRSRADLSARPSVGFLLKNLLVVAIILAGLSMPVVATEGYTCTTKHCTHHMEKLGKVCETHCHT